MVKNYTLKKDINSFYRAYIEIMKPFLKGITNREADVFAELLYQNYLKRSIDYKDRFKILFNSDSRKEIVTKLDISQDVFNVSLSKLKEKKLVNYDNTINELYLISPTDDNFSVTFNFQISE